MLQTRIEFFTSDEVVTILAVDTGSRHMYERVVLNEPGSNGGRKKHLSNLTMPPNTAFQFDLLPLLKPCPEVVRVRFGEVLNGN